MVRDLWTLRLQKLLGARNTVTTTVTDSFEYLSSDADVDNAQSTASGRVKRKLLRRNKRSLRPPGLMATLALCYLAAIMLRIPISLGDIHKWVDSQDIPYTLALQEIPKTMRQSLNPTYIKALRPTVGLPSEHILLKI